MSWRPDNWGNPWNDPKNVVEFCQEFMDMRTADGTSPEDIMRQDRRDIYEYGADQMLKALEPLIRKVAPLSKLIDILYSDGENSNQTTR